MAKQGQNPWNAMVTVMIDSGKYFNVETWETCTYTSELSVMQFCQQDPLLR